LTVYVFSADGTYLNYGLVTNSNGQALFTLPYNPVKFRVLWDNAYQWSDIVTPPTNVLFAFGQPPPTDTTPPVTVSDYAYDGVWINLPADITLTATDDDSGIAFTCRPHQATLKVMTT
jgi:hypothetical protein